MSKRTEKTSARVAKIAGRIYAIDPSRFHWHRPFFIVDTNGNHHKLSLYDIRALAASALAQTPDRKSRGIERRAGIAADERKRAKALIAAYAKKPKKNGRVKVSPWKYRRRGVVKK